MAKYKSKVVFTFTGTVTVEAESGIEAFQMIKDSVHLVLGRNIHTDINGKDVDWEFDMHPEKSTNFPIKEK